MESIASIAAAVGSGQVTATAVLAEHVARHRESHSRLNALIQPRHEAAQAELSTPPSGPLAGVPVSVKECFPIRGLATTLGIRGRRDLIDAHDASIVAALRRAGCTLIGKANVPQAMYLHETDNPVWGRTQHPHAPNRGPGGSSGGDAALVAAGVVPLAIGNDLAGSVRQPAHVCGIAALLPRHAALGEGGSVDTMPSLTAVRPRAGLLARTVADLGLACDSLLAPLSSPDPAAHRPLRLAAWETCGPMPGSPAVLRGLREAAERLTAAGASIDWLDGRLATDAAWLLLAILSADGGREIRRLFAGERPIPPVARLLRLGGLPSWLRPLLATLATATGSRIEAAALRATGPRSPAGFAELLERRAILGDSLAALRGRYDAVLCPVSALPALRHGTAARLLLAAAPCLWANLFDLAAGVVPATTVSPAETSGRPASRDPVSAAAADTDRESAGLPVGVQVVALDDGPAAERLVLEIMRLIETDRPRVTPATDQ